MRGGGSSANLVVAAAAVTRGFLLQEGISSLVHQWTGWGSGTVSRMVTAAVRRACALFRGQMVCCSPAGDKVTFPVEVRATPASERIRLWGRFLLAAGPDALELCDVREGTLVYTWPYRFLRRFGHDKVLVSLQTTP